MGVTAFNRGSRAVSQRIDVEMQLTRNSYRDHGHRIWVLVGVF